MQSGRSGTAFAMVANALAIAIQVDLYAHDNALAVLVLFIAELHHKRDCYAGVIGNCLCVGIHSVTF